MDVYILYSSIYQLSMAVSQFTDSAGPIYFVHQATIKQLWEFGGVTEHGSLIRKIDIKVNKGPPSRPGAGTCISTVDLQTKPYFKPKRQERS